MLHNDIENTFILITEKIEWYICIQTYNAYTLNNRTITQKVTQISICAYDINEVVHYI